MPDGTKLRQAEVWSPGRRATTPNAITILSSNRKPKLKSIGRWVLGISLLLVVTLGGFLIFTAATHNLHTVSDGKVYRAAQMDGAALNRVISEKGIKTIINLRGSGGDQDWYRAETNAAAQGGAEHYDFSLSASKEVDDRMMEQIVATLERAPKPVLIHCKNGADRSGLVGALYLYCLEGKPADAADKQLTMLYGHVPYLFWRDTIAMDRSFWRYVSNHVQTPGLKAPKDDKPISKN